MNYELFQMFQMNSTCVSQDIIIIDFLLLIVPQQLIEWIIRFNSYMNYVVFELCWQKLAHVSY